MQENNSDDHHYSPYKKRPDFEQRKDLSNPNVSFYFPYWNPTNQPEDTSCGIASGIFFQCYIQNILNLKSKKYREERKDDCRMKVEDLWLCMRLNFVKRDQKIKLLEEAYPWICDKTHGFRHRHIWKFRNRPPKYFDDPSISEEKYTLIRETLIKRRSGGILIPFIHLFSPQKIDKILNLTPKEYLEKIKNEMKINNLNELNSDLKKKILIKENSEFDSAMNDVLMQLEEDKSTLYNDLKESKKILFNEDKIINLNNKDKNENYLKKEEKKINKPIKKNSKKNVENFDSREPLIIMIWNKINKHVDFSRMIEKKSKEIIENSEDYKIDLKMEEMKEMEEIK